MALAATLKQDLDRALKQQDKTRVSVLRLLVNAVKNAEIEQQTELADEAVEKIIQKEAKQRQESIQAYRDGERPELADQEAAELAVLEEYLPEQLSDSEINAVIDEVIAETQPAGMNDMGKVMGVVSSKIGNRADGGHVAELVKNKLTQL